MLAPPFWCLTFSRRVIVHGIDQQAAISVNRRTAWPVGIGAFPSFDEGDHLPLGRRQVVSNNELLSASCAVPCCEPFRGYRLDNQEPRPDQTRVHKAQHDFSANDS